MRSTFHPCLPTAGRVVPATPNRLHEVEYDSYRLIVAGKAVLLGVDGIADFNALHSRHLELAYNEAKRRTLAKHRNKAKRGLAYHLINALCS